MIVRIITSPLALVVISAITLLTFIEYLAERNHR